MKTVRSYNKLVTELINLNFPYKLEICDYLSYDKIYPFLSLKYVSKMSNKTIIITGGHHGEEFFAVNVLLKWLRQPILFSEFNYYIFPCVNPYGYEKNFRNNANNQETNNETHFNKDSEVPELKILFEEFPRTADLILDIHGDTGKTGCYMYEHKSNNLPAIAEKALSENDAIIPYLRIKTIYGTKLVNGVLCPPKYDIGVEGFLETLGIQYSLTVELPGKFDGQKRAEGGVAIINSVLKYFKEAVCKEKE
jgi:predicted deacylase